jgi:site-specific recombinase XerD
MRAAGPAADGARLRALIVILWRSGLRIGEALELAESDLDPHRGAILVRHGKRGRRREVGMDRWAWGQLQSWERLRAQLPVGALLCVIHGPTAGRRWESSAVRHQFRRTAARAGVRRRFAPHQLRHAHAVEMAHEGRRDPAPTCEPWGYQHLPAGIDSAESHAHPLTPPSLDGSDRDESALAFRRARPSGW